MTPTVFDTRTDALFATLKRDGLWKELQTIDSPMDASIKVRGADGKARDVLCFCSNNYLGLANHPEVVEAGLKGLRDYGAGTASVRFICGTFSPHHALETALASYMGTEASYTFVSCWNANEAVFPTLCDAGDIIISDELNHASIIDSVRLATTIKKGLHKALYKNNVLEGPGSLREALEAAKKNPAVTGQVWVVTDGVFSMEGSIANLPAMRRLCDQYGAMLVVDDSHGHGVMGETGRGTHEYWGMLEGCSASAEAVSGLSALGVFLTKGGTAGKVDLFTGTLGKALGGAAGGFVAGSRRAIDLIVQRGRPTLFSNALPVSVALSAAKAVEILRREPERVKRLRDNVAYARKSLKDAGFSVLPSPTAILPIIVHDTAKAIAMSKKLLDLGVFVIGFGFPVVPEGHARLRCQVSAAHTTQHIDALVAALKKL